jgi:hypothetical protein
MTDYQKEYLEEVGRSVSFALQRGDKTALLNVGKSIRHVMYVSLRNGVIDYFFKWLCIFFVVLFAVPLGSHIYKCEYGMAIWMWIVVSVNMISAYMADFRVKDADEFICNLEAIFKKLERMLEDACSSDR